VRGIEGRLGVSIAPPPGAMAVVGITTPSGVLHYRHLNAIYVAYRLRTLLASDRAVGEYGGGLGVVAFYARRFGIRDYTLFDIPLTNVFAGNFLIRALGQDAVSLYGESQNPDTIRVLPFWECAAAAAGAFHLSLNQDSFPEIDEDLVRRYLDEIARTTDGYFLSINHEGESPMTPERRQLNVAAIMNPHTAFDRVSRFKYWLREGYVEELYRVR